MLTDENGEWNDKEKRNMTRKRCIYGHLQGVQSLNTYKNQAEVYLRYLS